MSASSPLALARLLEDGLRDEPQFNDRKVIYFPGSFEFDESENEYFNAAASEVKSAAIARPTSTADVSALIKAFRRHLPSTTHIAVRGAGHATYAGTAKAVGGITIDSELNKTRQVASRTNEGTVRGLRGVDILPDQKHVRIAPGERWASVLAKLEAHEPPLITVGGRSPKVGATGFLLGAGLSFLSGGYGFSADLVTAWEVHLFALPPPQTPK